MKIAALLKQVPDTETKIRIKADASGIEESDIKYIVNPYCEFAVEEAIKPREKNPGSEAVAISLGPDRAVEAIRTALAMGMDKGIHIQHTGGWLDSFSVATVLAKVIGQNNFDVIFCGKQAIDEDAGQTAQMIAEILNIPQVMVIEKFELKDAKTAVVTRRVSGGAKEIYETPLPILVGCEKGLNTPRYASLPGIMKAKTKPVQKLLSTDLLAGSQSLVQFVNYQLPPERKAGKKLDGEPAQQAKELARLLREEAKVI